MKKKVAIIGAGISGLFFANLLKNSSDYDFTIFEKKTSIDTEDGYGIQLSVNSIKLLNEIGFKNIETNEIYFPKKVNFYDAKNCKKISDIDISKFNYENNHYTTLKRSTLLNFLLKNIPESNIVQSCELNSINYQDKIINDKNVEKDIKDLALNELEVLKKRLGGMREGNAKNHDGEDSKSVVEAASQIVATTNKRLQDTMKELDVIRQLLDKERKAHDETKKRLQN